MSPTPGTQGIQDAIQRTRTYVLPAWLSIIALSEIPSVPLQSHHPLQQISSAAREGILQSWTIVPLRRCNMERNPTKVWNTFDDVFKIIQIQPENRTPVLRSTGKHVCFSAEAKYTQDGRRFIALPHNNRIYEHDWGYSTNSMGKTGQRIGQYSIPIDEWALRLFGLEDKP